MQAAERVEGIWIGSGVRLELPEPLHELAQAVLGPLCERLFAPASPPLPEPELQLDSLSITRVERGPDGWWLQHGCTRERAAGEVALLLRLQELALEAAARCRRWLLFRGSVVTRGSQSVMIAGDSGDAHVLLAVALAALEFRPVSIGLAAFDGCPPRGYPAPLPLPLAFALPPEEPGVLPALTQLAGKNLAPALPSLYRSSPAIAAPEPTHVLFLDAAHRSGSLVRPISATAARARLCGALTVAPDDPPPFAAVAALLRHARGICLPVGELSHTLEQLGRLLPRWNVD